MKGRIIGEGDQPLICTPLVGKNEEELISELKKVLEKKPDILEWRVDFYEGIINTASVVALLKRIKKIAGYLPVIFTIRSTREGGQPIPLSDRQIINLMETVCRNTDVEYIDCELSTLPENIARICRIAAANDTKVIASFHDFKQTPNRETLLGKFKEAQRYGADVVKLAVMANEPVDLLTLLDVTLEAKNIIDIPIITVSMGKYGVLSRIIGGIFGSSVTFAVGQKSSAPGQIPIEDLQLALDIVQKSIQNENNYEFYLREPNALSLITNSLNIQDSVQ